MLVIIEFVYNNAKTATIGPMSFKLNYSYHSVVFYEENIHSCSKLKTVEKLSGELCEQIIIGEKISIMFKMFRKD